MDSKLEVIQKSYDMMSSMSIDVDDIFWQYGKNADSLESEFAQKYYELIKLHEKLFDHIEKKANNQ